MNGLFEYVLHLTSSQVDYSLIQQDNTNIGKVWFKYLDRLDGYSVRGLSFQQSLP